MIPQLNAISITDFRSLRGNVIVPLDAPVVLIHGPNGAGKTSVLSALELVLTGQVLEMRRTDPGYQAHLKNRDAAYGKIVLTDVYKRQHHSLPLPTTTPLSKVSLYFAIVLLIPLVLIVSRSYAHL